MEKKILENWKAIEELEERVREKTGDPDAGFNADTFWFGEDGRHLMIPCLYRGKKGKKGSEAYSREGLHMKLEIQGKSTPSKTIVSFFPFKYSMLMITTHLSI